MPNTPLLKKKGGFISRFKYGYHIVFAVLVIILAVCPFVMSTTAMIQFLGKCMCYAMVAIGLDLVWGYTGMLSLGHGLYFCLGGYAMAMYLKLKSNGGNITDFMQIAGINELPTFWKPFLSEPLTFILILAVPAVVAGVIGFFVFRSRIKGVYFSIITQALTWAAYSIFIANSGFTGGNNGITDFDAIVGKTRGPANKGNLITLFIITLVVLVVIYAVASFLVNRKFGKLLIAIRDGENRTFFSGYCVNRYKNVIYIISAIMAAIGGALFVNFNGSITPTQMTISFSVTMVIWVAVGGRGTILGAVLGTFLINLCEYNLSSGALVDVWQYILGAIFCLAILFFKGGIIGLFKEQIPALIRRITKSDKNKKEAGTDAA
ncbi:MAG: urea ABC transporter permease subunit UrtC [Clostridia bacterium]|nr:urea ABC transporter permease subunit UrtC [Clostridia bacterium]